MTRNEQFKQELLDLLKKYDAEMCAEEATNGWGTSVWVYSRAKWSEDGSTKLRDAIRLEFNDTIGEYQVKV